MEKVPGGLQRASTLPDIIDGEARFVVSPQTRAQEDRPRSHTEQAHSAFGRELAAKLSSEAAGTEVTRRPSNLSNSSSSKVHRLLSNSDIVDQLDVPDLSPVSPLSPAAEPRGSHVSNRSAGAALVRAVTQSNLENKASGPGITKKGTADLVANLSQRESKTSQGSHKAVKSRQGVQLELLDTTALSGIQWNSLESYESMKVQVPLPDKWQFNFVFGLIIVLNAVLVSMETDMASEDLDQGHRIEMPESIMEGFEVFFTLAFLLELAIRMLYAASVRDFFKIPWNLADAFVVALSVLDLVLQAAQVAHIEQIQSWIRLLKLYRLMRLVRFFKELREVVRGLATSMRTLSWVLILISLLIFVMSVFLEQVEFGNPDTLRREDQAEYREDFNVRFGSVLRTMWALFELLTLEGWTHWAMPIVKSKPGWSLFFIVYIMFMHFGILNLIIAIMAEEMIGAKGSTEDTIQRIEDTLKEKQLETLKRIFLAIDSSGDLTLSKQEFEMAMLDPNIIAAFKKVKIPAQDFTWLFDLLDDDGSDSVDIYEFIQGCLRLNGLAKSQDLFQVLMQVTMISTMLRRFQQDILPDFILKMIQLLPGGMSEADEEMHRHGNDAGDFDSSNPKLGKQQVMCWKEFYARAEMIETRVASQLGVLENKLERLFDGQAKSQK